MMNRSRYNRSRFNGRQRGRFGPPPPVPGSVVVEDAGFAPFVVHVEDSGIPASFDVEDVGVPFVVHIEDI